MKSKKFYAKDIMFYISWDLRIFTERKEKELISEEGTSRYIKLLLFYQIINKMVMIYIKYNHSNCAKEPCSQRRGKHYFSQPKYEEKIKQIFFKRHYISLSSCNNYTIRKFYYKNIKLLLNRNFNLLIIVCNKLILFNCYIISI